MSDIHEKPRSPHLVWIYAGSLSETLDSATWLETTRELRKLGWHVTLINVGPSGWQSIGGVKTLCVSQPEYYLVRKIVFHVKTLLFLGNWWSNIDLILFHQISAPWFLPLRVVRSLKSMDRPLLVMDTRTIPMSVATWKARVRAIFEYLMNQLANKWADGQTAITGRMAQAVHVPEQHLWGTWPSGVNLNQFEATQMTRQWPLPSMPTHLIYVGVLYRERNLMALCQAVEAANSEGMSFVLSIVGDGPERSDLEAFALQTQGQIRVIPPVPHEHIPALLGRAHVGALPFPDRKKFRVSSPIKLFEYMAAGMPILATRIACHTDVIGEKKFVFWAEGDSVEALGNALRQVWQNRSSLSRMGRESGNAANSWTWTASARKLSDALKKGMAKQLVFSDYAKTGGISDRVIAGAFSESGDDVDAGSE